MTPGSVAEIAIWLDGTETPQQIDHWKTVVVPGSLAECEQQFSLIMSPPEFSVKRPGQERVPPVPDHVHGPDVRLLIAEATVLAKRQRLEAESGFVFDLTKEDLEKLRRMTRRAHQRQHPGMPKLTDAQCDQVIEFLGPDVVMATLRDDKTLH